MPGEPKGTDFAAIIGPQSYSSKIGVVGAGPSGKHSIRPKGAGPSGKHSIRPKPKQSSHLSFGVSAEANLAERLTKIPRFQILLST